MPTPIQDPEAVERVIKDRIEAARRAEGLTRKAVYTSIGISRNTFELKMAGGSFTVRELIKAARAVKLHFDDLLRDL
jgi:cell division ATPase FtsA